MNDDMRSEAAGMALMKKFGKPPMDDTESQPNDMATDDPMKSTIEQIKQAKEALDKKDTKSVAAILDGIIKQHADSGSKPDMENSLAKQPEAPSKF